MNPGEQSVLTWLGFLFVLTIYFLPSLVAISRAHERQFSIALANLFLGWTVVGWALTIVWAFSNQTVDHPEGGFQPGTNWTTDHLNPERLATILFLAVAAIVTLVAFNHRWKMTQPNPRQPDASVAAKLVGAPAATPLPPPDRIALADRACPLSESQKAILASLSFGNVEQVWSSTAACGACCWTTWTTSKFPSETKRSPATLPNFVCWTGGQEPRQPKEQRITRLKKTGSHLPTTIAH